MSTSRAEWRAGWRVVFGSALALGTALPVWNYVSSLFTVPLTTEFGWTRGELASASASAFLGSLAAPFVGKFADHFGARRVLLIGLLGYAAMFMALAFQPGTLAAYTLIIMLHTMVGIACGGAIFSRAVAGWFDKSRGFALGLTMTGVPLAAALVTPLLQSTIASYGWQSGFFLLAFLTVGVGVPLTLIFIREKEAPQNDEVNSPMPSAKDGADWSYIRRSPGFWLLALSLLPINAAGTGLMSSMAPILTDGGLSGSQAASLVSMFAIAVIIARLGTGWLIDRFSPHIVAAAVSVVPAFGCAALMVSDGSFLWAALALILIGVQQGAEIDLVGFLLAKLFGMKNYASAYGVCVVFLGLSGAFGVAWYGRSYDAFQGYHEAIAFSIPCYVVGAILLYALGSTMRRIKAVV